MHNLLTNIRSQLFTLAATLFLAVGAFAADTEAGQVAHLDANATGFEVSDAPGVSDAFEAPGRLGLEKRAVRSILPQFPSPVLTKG
jgi:hypothetical protein